MNDCESALRLLVAAAAQPSPALEEARAACTEAGDQVEVDTETADRADISGFYESLLLLNARLGLASLSGSAIDFLDLVNDVLREWESLS